jgi:hypothetical protein
MRMGWRAIGAGEGAEGAGAESGQLSQAGVTMIAGCAGRPMAAAPITGGAQALCLKTLRPATIGALLRKLPACQVQNQ